MRKTISRTPAIAFLLAALTTSLAIGAPPAGMGAAGAAAGATPGGGMPAGRAADAAGGDMTSWDLTAGVTHSDNIALSPIDRTSDSILQTGLQLQVADTRPRLDTRISADISYWDFVNHSFKSQVVGGADAGLNFAIVPSRFSWSLHDNFGQLAVDPTAVVTPGNIQNVNLLSTGPTIALPLGSDVNTLVLQGLYSKADYGTTLQDNQQYLGSVALQHKLSERTTVSLNGSDTHTVYDDSQVGSSFDVREESIGFDAIGVRTSLSSVLGYTELRFLGQSHDGLLARLGLTRFIGSRSKLSLEIGTDYTDSATQFAEGQQFRGVQTVPGVQGLQGSVSDAAVSIDPFKSDYAIGAWDLLGTRSTLTFGFTLRSETHQQETQFDRRLGTATVTFTRHLSPLFVVSASGSYNRERFSNLDVDLNTWILGAGLDWTLSRTLAVQTRFYRQDGSGIRAARNYTEDRAYIGISYSDGRRIR